MAKLRPLKTNFTNGEIDPLIGMRSDLQLYANGASKLRNALPFPQGGVKRRPGLEHMTVIPPGNQIKPIGIVGGTLAAAGLNYVVGELLTVDNGTFDTAAVFRVTKVDVNDAGLINKVVFGEIDAAGSGYAMNDTVSLLIDVPSVPTPATFIIDDIDLGIPQHITLVDGGEYSTVPAPNSDTLNIIGTGSGLTVKNIETQVAAPILELELINAGDYTVVPGSSTTTSNFDGTGATIDSFISETQDIVVLLDFIFSNDQQYLIVFTVSRFYVFRKEDTGFGSNQLVAQGTHPYTNEQIREFVWSQNLDVMLIFHKDHSIMKITRTSEAVWTFETFEIKHPPTFAFGVSQTNAIEVHVGADTFLSGVTKNITTTADTFIIEDIGKYIRIFGSANVNGLDPSSFYKILSFTNERFISVEILNPPLVGDTFTVQGGEWLIEESEWSPEHGYPRCGTFFQGRLCVAGSRDRPNTFWASRAGDISDFNAGGVRDDLGIIVTSDAGTSSTFQYIYPGRHLQLFADSAEFYVPSSDAQPMTPTTMSLRRTTSVGSNPDIPIFEVDGVVYFMQQGGQSIRKFVFVDDEQAYSSDIVSLFSSHLIRSSRDAAIKRSLSTDDGNYIWIVNNDGSMAAFSVLRSELINAWSLHTTRGMFKNVAVLGQTTYFHIPRTPGGRITYSGLSELLDDHIPSTTFDPHGLAYNDDGTKLFIINNQAPELAYEFDLLGTPYTLERVAFSGESVDLTTAAPNARDIGFSANGLTMFIMDTETDNILLEYTLSVAFSFAGAVTLTGNTFIPTEASASTVEGFDFSHDGMKLFVSNVTTIYAYDLGTAFSLAGTVTYTGQSFDISTITTFNRGIKISKDGLRIVMIGDVESTIFLLHLTTAFDLATASDSGKFLDITTEDSQPLGLAFSADDKILLVGGNGTESLFQYNLEVPGTFGNPDEEQEMIEIFNPDLLMDGGVIATDLPSPAVGVAGLTFLKNEPVEVILDDVFIGVLYVDDSGTLTFPYPAQHSYQFGIPFPTILDDETGLDTGFNVLIKTLPSDILLQAGTTMGKKKRISACTVRFVDTQGFYLQNIQVPFRSFPQTFDTFIPKQSGEQELRGLLGWDDLGQITIGQKEPQAMTILGLAYNLSSRT